MARRGLLALGMLVQSTAWNPPRPPSFHSQPQHPQHQPQQQPEAWLGRRATVAGLAGLLLPFRSPPEAQAMWQLWFPSDMLEYVNRYATPGSPDSVLAAMDKAAETSWMMNMGREKGDILEGLIAQRGEAKPVTTVLELGTFCGYCTIRLARSLPSTSTVVTVEKDPSTYQVAREIIGRAGLLDDPEFSEYAAQARAKGLRDHARVEMHLGASGDVIPQLRQPYTDGFDFVLMDHWKELYDVDLQKLEKLKLVRENSAVLADNIRIPGAPRYLEYLYHGPGLGKWDTTIVDVPFEYRPETPDAMAYSIFYDPRAAKSSGAGRAGAGAGNARKPGRPPPREACNYEAPATMRSPVDRLICEAELNSPNDGSGTVSGG